MYNSITNDAGIGAKVVFSLFGILGLWSINSQLKQQLFFVKGKDELVIENGRLNVMRKFGFLKSKKRYKLHRFKKVVLNVKDEGSFIQIGNMFGVEYGTIVLGKSKRNSVVIGQFLKKEDLLKIYDELKERMSIHKKTNDQSQLTINR